MCAEHWKEQPLASRNGQFPQGSFLASLSAKSRAAMLELGTVREFAPMAVLLRQGETTSHAFLLVDGCVKITATTPDGHLALLAIRAAGELIGELACMDGQPRIATVTTAGRVRTRLLAQPEFLRFLERHPDVALAVSSSVASKLRWATRRRLDFGNCEVSVRLARILVELAATYGISVGTWIEIGVPLTQPELAALVGAAEPTVHKALTRLRREGIVDTGYRRIFVCDQGRLAVRAEA
jgi:CRP/FNR family transcriptional regulator, cyclic AMP receptor protein